MQISAYEQLYASSDLLWPPCPGRMVRAAATRMPPGRCLDIGCGDGKNALYLAELGWHVDGNDISARAIAAAHKRFAQAGQAVEGSLHCQDALRGNYPAKTYDLVVCYGVYHCLTDDEISVMQKNITTKLKIGGLFAFAAFNDNLPLPGNHHTGALYLRPEDHIFNITSDTFMCLKKEIGIITETHLPLVGEHQHGLTWALLQKK